MSRLWLLAGLLTAAGLHAEKAAASLDGLFESRCSACHGGDATGGDRAPSLVTYVRYHTDAELAQVVRGGRVEKGMPAFALSDADCNELASKLRVTAGTNPAMSTAGLTGQNRRLPSAKIAAPTVKTGTMRLSSGVTLEGTVLNQGDFSAVVLTGDGKFHLLARDGDAWRDKAIEPKSDWTTYHGSNSGNRYSALGQIDTTTVKSLALRWIFPIPSSPRIEATPIVVDGVMYVTGWNEVWALDATTGQQIWMFRQPHTDGLLSEAGRGANRGVAVSGDRLFAVSDNAHLIALDRRTGAKLWDSAMGDVRDGYSATGAPLAVGELVISGAAGGEEGARVCGCL